MLGIGAGEFAIIAVFAFLLFGPDKLPQIGHTVGRAIRQFRETQEKMTAVVQSEVIDPMTAAAQAPAAKVASGASAASDDDDADVAAEKVAEARKETFAERRARLAAEKEAREAEQAAASEESAEGEPAASAAEGSAAAAEPAAPAEPAKEPVAKKASGSAENPAEQQEAEKPASPSIDDLYARRPRKHKAATEEANDGDAAAAAPADATSEGGEQ